MDYLLMCVAISFAAVNSVILRIFKNRTFRTPGDVFFFNGGVSLVWIVVMATWCAIDGAGFSFGTVAYAAAYAVILCLFLYLKTEALATGPVALTTLISSAAFIVPTLFGVLRYREGVSLAQGLGMALITLSLFMCINPKKSGEKLSARWFIYCFAFFLVGGILGIFYKIFGASPYAGEVNGMMLCASAFSAILFFAFGMVLNAAKKASLPRLPRESLFFVLTSGIAGCIYIRLNISLSAVIPSAIFFPVSNGALVLISTAAGCALFREKLSRLQVAGLLVGLVAIAVTGCGDAILSLLK